MIENDRNKENGNKKLQFEQLIKNRENLRNRYQEECQTHEENKQLNRSLVPLSWEKRVAETNKSQPSSQTNVEQENPKKLASNSVAARSQQIYSEDVTSGLRQQNTPANMLTGAAQSQRPESTNTNQIDQTKIKNRFDQKIIMVVDDSQTVRNIMALILNRSGYRSVRVASAMEALHTLTELIPDLIFLDVTLPGMDGLDVCKIIKENPRTKKVPVVMLSGNSEVFDKVMGRLAGASDYITKPFEPEAIINSINKFCGQKSHLREGLWQKAR